MVLRRESGLVETVRVEVYKDYENGTLGLGVRVVDDEATVADLLEVWEPLSDDPGVSKRYDSRGVPAGAVSTTAAIRLLLFRT